MQFTFDSVEEIRTFVKEHLKDTRGRKGKGEGDGDGESTAGVPTPVMPPNNPPGMTGFQPNAPGPAAGPFGASSTPSFGGTTLPEVTALVQRINAKIDGALASGQPADAVLNWFRQRCGAEAAAATLDQIKTVYLAKLSIPHLEETAKLMGA